MATTSDRLSGPARIACQGDYNAQAGSMRFGLSANASRRPVASVVRVTAVWEKVQRTTVGLRDGPERIVDLYAHSQHDRLRSVARAGAFVRSS